MDADGRVQIIGPEPSGFAQMLAAIVQANLARHPDRASLLEGEPGVVRITAVDAQVSVALEFRDGKLRIYSGERTSPPDVHVMADSETLTGFSSVPQMGPIPHPFKAEGRAVLRKAFRGQVKVKGAARNGKLLKRMRGVMAMDAQ